MIFLHRIFYVNPGNVPAATAEQRLQKVRQDVEEKNKELPRSVIDTIDYFMIVHDQPSSVHVTVLRE